MSGSTTCLLKTSVAIPALLSSITSLALDEFLDGDIDWEKSEENIEH